MVELTVSAVARLIGGETGNEVKPRDISQLFYDRKLREDLAPTCKPQNRFKIGVLRLVNTTLTTLPLHCGTAGCRFEPCKVQFI